jgi:hypothetical protein
VLSSGALGLERLPPSCAFQVLAHALSEGGAQAASGWILPLVTALK